MSGALCPFNDGSMCSSGDAEVVHFSPGPVNARVLGINTPMPVEFSRETTCAPITVNGSFVEINIKNTSVLLHYYYGMSFIRGDPGKPVKVDLKTASFVHPWSRWAEFQGYRLEYVLGMSLCRKQR